jgi:hypothetical protein
MPPIVTNGATIACSFGAAPGTLIATPMGTPITISGQFVATINTMIPMANIMPFGMCMSLTNPQVAAATSAAMGVLTPQPCIPVITAPWTPGSATVAVGGIPALTAPSTCQCAWAGVITISSPGQATVQTES